VKNNKVISKKIRVILWFMLSLQMIAWGVFSYFGGELSDKGFLIFSTLMLTGQVGGTVECFLTKAWATMAVQIFFFIFTAFGAYQRIS